MSTISASTTSTTGFKVTSDTTGTLVFQTGASPTTAMSISSSQIISFTNPPTATGGGSVSTNTAFGTSALASNTTGAQNTALGYQAGYANTTGGIDALGYQAGYNNTTGAGNLAIGASALYTNQTGAANTAIGGNSLNLNTGDNNVAVGRSAAQNNSTGSENTVIGRSASYSNTTGSYNVAIGRSALFSNTTASNNTAVGYQAGYSNTTGYSNTAVGYQAGYSNTTGTRHTMLGSQAGYSANGGDPSNGALVAVGYQAGYTYAVTGAGNEFYGTTIIGAYAGYSVNTANNTALGGFALNGAAGANNTAIGAAALYSTTGTFNTAVGRGAGASITSGSKNTVVGAYSGNQANYDIRTQNGCVVISDGDGVPRIGYDVIGIGQYINAASGSRYTQFTFANNMVAKSIMYWDNTLTNLYVQNASGGVYLTNTGTSWTSASDERLKENLTPIENGLSKVCSLRSVIGNFIADETKKPTPFLIAQDVQSVLPEAVTTSTLKDDETNTEYLGVAYTEVIPLLVAAIKELKAEIDTLKGQA